MWARSAGRATAQRGTAMENQEAVEQALLDFRSVCNKWSDLSEVAPLVQYFTRS
jgi:hypothetical protein